MAGVADPARQDVLFWFFYEGVDEPAFIHLHDPEVGGVTGIDGDGGDGDVRTQFLMVIEHLHKVHLVELITRQYEYVITVEGPEMPEALTDGVCRSLIPGGVVGGLFGGKDVDKGRAERAEMIGVLYM